MNDNEFETKDKIEPQHNSYCISFNKCLSCIPYPLSQISKNSAPLHSSQVCKSENYANKTLFPCSHGFKRDMPWEWGLHYHHPWGGSGGEGAGGG